jgi:hypothetical protein
MMSLVRAPAEQRASSGSTRSHTPVMHNAAAVLESMKAASATSVINCA